MVPRMRESIYPTRYVATSAQGACGSDEKGGKVSNAWRNVTQKNSIPGDAERGAADEWQEAGVVSVGKVGADSIHNAAP